MSASASRTASQRDRWDRRRADGQAGKILSMLIAAGQVGCTNSQLWTVCHAVNSRINDLRRQGHRISAEGEGHGVWRYRLNPRPTHEVSAFEQARREEFEREAPLFASAGIRA